MSSSVKTKLKVMWRPSASQKAAHMSKQINPYMCKSTQAHADTRKHLWVASKCVLLWERGANFV